MADDILKSISEFSNSLCFDNLPEKAVIAAKERIIDSLACTLGGFNCKAGVIARKHAGPAASQQYAGRIVGQNETVSADAAAFANTCMLRNLDFNDTYPGSHPTDAYGAIFALAPTAGDGVSGEALITAAVISHETIIRHVRAANPSDQGFDQGTTIAMGVAAGAANLLGLTCEQTEHAVSIATVGNVHLRATRSGELSMWKGCATALAVRNAVQAILLASDGMSGPPEPFRGRHGLADHYPSFKWTPYGLNTEDFYIDKANLKYWPVANQMQAAAWCGIELGKQLGVTQIDSILVEANEFAHFESGSEPEKWDPQTKETADHSLPYILAWGLMHGTIGADAFDSEAYLSPQIRPFLKKINVTINEQFTTEYPDEMHMRATAKTKDGKEHVADILNPIGHPKNPMGWNDIENKFMRLSEGFLGREEASKIFRLMHSMETIENIAEVFNLISAGNTKGIE